MRSTSAFISRDRAPCFQAFWLPSGAPLPLPPCIRHRALPLIAGERHGWPERVRAWQRGARCALCMGLFAKLAIRYSPLLWGVVVELIRDDSLTALVHMNMPDGLLSRLVQLDKRLESGTALCLGLQSKAAISLHCWQAHAHARGHPAEHLCGHIV